MKKSDTHAFVNQLLVGTLAMILFSGTIGLGAVWMRHQISITAQTTRQIENTLSEVERRIAETTALIAAEQSPEALEQKNAKMAIGLVPKRDSQIVWVAESPEERLAARRNLEIFAEETVRTRTPIRFGLTGNRTP